MVGGGVDDDMNIIPGHDLPEIRIDLGRHALDRELDGGGGGVGFVHVADGQNIPVAAGIGCIAAPHAPATDEGDAGPVVGSQSSGGLGGGQLLALDKPERQAGHGREHSAALEKSAAREVE